MYACGFRVYFTPLPGFFSPFPHGTGSLSVDHEYLALEDGPPIFRQDSTCPALLFATLVPPFRFRIRGYHPLWPDFPDRFASNMAKSCRLLRFRSPLLSESRLISVSSPYLDVSVQEVRLTHPMNSGADTPPYMTLRLRTSLDRNAFALAFARQILESHLWRGGFPHSDIPGSKPVCRLLGAFRKLLRPSSPVIAKASTTCTYSLDPITLPPPIG